MIGKTDFAFAGTVTAIGDAADPGAREVAFRVGESFHGDLPSTVEIRMPAPSGSGEPETYVEDWSLDYSVGSRLLVSGADQWPKDNKATLLAWGCGFTLPYDATIARTWRAAE